jgi:hypothetical protein
VINAEILIGPLEVYREALFGWTGSIIERTCRCT